MKYDIFISYSRKDSAVVQSVVDRLKAEGYTCWMDVNGIESGDAFKRVLVQAIKESKLVLFFSSANSNSTEWTVKEINIAVGLKKPIIPVRLDDAPYDDSILFDLSGLDYIPYQKESIYEAGLEKLRRGVAGKCGAATTTLHEQSNSKPASNVIRKALMLKRWYVIAPPLLVVAAGIVLMSVNKLKCENGVKDTERSTRSQIVRQTHEDEGSDEDDNQSIDNNANNVRLIIQRVDPLNKYNFDAWPIDWNVDNLEVKLQILKQALDKLETIEKLKATEDADDQPIGRATLKYS